MQKKVKVGPVEQVVLPLGCWGEIWSNCVGLAILSCGSCNLTVSGGAVPLAGDLRWL